MLKYEELYEILRKEKTNDSLQKISSDFIKDFSNLIHENKRNITSKGDFFAEDIIRDKKQYENSMILFKELMLRRKKKILNLVFIANETSVMKRDFENMFPFEKDLFDGLLSSIEQTDKLISMLLINESSVVNNTSLIITDDVESFVGMDGESIGPFKKGQSVLLDKITADVLIGGQKAVSV
ncbi:MAG: hypothetical protein AABX23_05300 [Nanoarchaeota archaeon]